MIWGVTLARPVTFARRIVTVLWIAVIVEPALAQPLPEAGLARGPDIIVAAARGPAELELADGRRVMLAALLAEPLPPDDPARERVRQRLAELTLDARVRAYADGPPRDRHGRLRAHLVTADGQWVQAVLLREGLALLAPWWPDRAVLAELQRAEARARATRAGLWGGHWRVLTAEPPPRVETGRYSLIAGRVASVGRSQAGVYLNFGSDYRTDSTLFVPSGRLRAFGGMAGLRALEGRRVLARGMMDWWNGPFLRLDRPALLQTLAD